MIQTTVFYRETIFDCFLETFHNGVQVWITTRGRATVRSTQTKWKSFYGQFHKHSVFLLNVKPFLLELDVNTGLFQCMMNKSLSVKQFYIVALFILIR